MDTRNYLLLYFINFSLVQWHTRHQPIFSMNIELIESYGIIPLYNITYILIELLINYDSIDWYFTVKWTYIWQSWILFNSILKISKILRPTSFLFVVKLLCAFCRNRDEQWVDELKITAKWIEKNYHPKNFYHYCWSFVMGFV